MVAFEKVRKRVYFAVILFGVICIFATPVFAYADIFGYQIQDVYAQITENVKETNSILKKAFEFAQTSPYDIIESLEGAVRIKMIQIRSVSKTTSLVVASMLLMIEFFRKSINFEWSSKWENILIFLIKIIVVKQIVQNADTIVSYIYSGFQYLNSTATNPNLDFLPYESADVFTWVDDGMFSQMVKKGWWDYWYDKGGGESTTTYTYLISQNAVKMFYPNATFGGTDLNEYPLDEPTTMLFTPTIEIVLLQPYFLIMKAIAYMIFVIAIGRVFELSVYTIFAPLPLATFASDTTHDVAKSFIKNYIATVIQIVVIVVMFLVYAAVNHYFTTTHFAATLKLLQLIELIALGLGVMRSGTWARRLCGIG